MARKPRTPPRLQLVVQEGGSSIEFYATFYNTTKQAERAIRSHHHATYNAFGPFEVPVTSVTPDGEALVKESDVIQLIEDTLRGQQQ
jgi:hypothetical protein